MKNLALHNMNHMPNRKENRRKSKKYSLKRTADDVAVYCAREKKAATRKRREAAANAV